MKNLRLRIFVLTWTIVLVFFLIAIASLGVVAWEMAETIRNIQSRLWLDFAVSYVETVSFAILYILAGKFAATMAYVLVFETEQINSFVYDEWKKQMKRAAFARKVSAIRKHSRTFTFD